MARSDKLETYRSKRDFRKTPEPRGSTSGSSAGAPRFVIHEHDASSHHFDLRLEIGGALASWAVPKGPSTDPGDKRLAVRTEDHPLEYADFEGVIPEDEYGAGTVVVWDAGTFGNLKTDDDDREIPLEECLDDGHVVVWLEGKKLRGGYSLVHAKPGGDENAWLLVKKDDDAADARRKPVKTEPESVISGRTIDEVAEEESGKDDG